MKTTAILYDQHQEIARIPINDIDYIFPIYPIVGGLRVCATYGDYECDEVEFIKD